MSGFFKVIDDAIRVRGLMPACALAAGAFGTWFILWLVWPTRQPPLETLCILVVWLALQSLVLFSVYRVFSENKRVTRSAYQIHAINHEYRNALSGLFSVSEAVQSRKERLKIDQLMQVERIVLNRVCENIAEIFSTMVARKCVVTVKLVSRDDSGCYCFTWARSRVRNDDSSFQRFKVGTGSNTGFDEALRVRPGEPSYFHGADLIAMRQRGEYVNERKGWEHFYNSAIVVPIRYRAEDDKIDEVGFLCLDTQSPNRLNKTYHVHLLAAFADQMYNFISIMRRKFVLIAEDNPEPSAISSSEVKL